MDSSAVDESEKTAEVDWFQELRNDGRSIDELVTCALTDDETPARTAIAVLHFRSTTQVFDRAKRLCESERFRERRLGADILAQFGSFEKEPTPQFDETVDQLLAMLSTELHESVLNSIAVALGHRHAPKSIEPLARLKSHPHEDVRFGVAYSLAGFQDSIAINTLIELTRDAVPIVRDWATFGLGTLNELDNPALRQALWERTDDPDDNTRLEALVGLAKRKDDRIVPKLMRELQQPDLYQLAFEAAHELGNSQLLPVLRKLQDDPFDEEFQTLIAASIAQCHIVE